MKPRILQTTKILAVALTATVAACTASNAKDDMPRAEPQAPSRPAPGAAAAMSPEARATPAPPGDAAGTPDGRPLSKDPALLALRKELIRADREAVLADAARYRPLCDADGYPLVGNVMTKAANYQPSAFCATVRAKRAAR